MHKKYLRHFVRYIGNKIISEIISKFTNTFILETMVWPYKPQINYRFYIYMARKCIQHRHTLIADSRSSIINILSRIVVLNKLGCKYYISLGTYQLDDRVDRPTLADFSLSHCGFM